jgi:quinoprotein glucose dehydrogenase
MQFCRTRRWVSLLALLAPLALPAAEADVSAVTSAGATDDAATAIRKFRAAPGMKIDLFAAEPMLANVVSFAFDEHGRCYVVESNRRRTSVFDIRGLGEWLDSDYSFRTVEDRANFFRTTLSPANSKLPDFLKAKRNLLSDYNQDGTLDWHDLEVQSERIRLLVDTNADGRADVATVLAEGFDGITSGVAAGVLARKGDVWFTCIPDLWKMSNDELRMTNGVPKLSMPINPHQRHSSFVISNLLSGFGVHIAFGGHDMHGLKMGPDGKIYFSIADRGTGTNLWDKIVDKWPGLTMEALADSGGVFRCNQDGTEFEVVCIGLRNPQELAFDEFGNLFAGENNADGGDKARWIHVVDGADYGWRIGWQWLPKLGAWNSEMLWGMAGTNTSAYYLPPVAHIGAGPAGIAYYPGTGLPARYDRHFFMCDFRGGPNSVVRSFALRPKGASFEAYDESEFLTGPLCTDVDFGTDGAVYVSDWVKGWDKTDKGRIYRVFDPNTVNDPAVLEVKKLLGEGMEKRTNEELARMLGHRDMRVRLEAQWELGSRTTSNQTLYDAAESTNLLVAVHATSALRTATKVNQQTDTAGFRPEVKIISRLRNQNPELRAQAVQILGDIHSEKFVSLVNMSFLESNPDDSATRAFETVRKNFPAEIDTAEQNLKTITGVIHLKDDAPRVRFFAAQALGKIAHKQSVKTLFTLLRDNNDQDAYLRHAAVFALARIGDVPALLAAAKDASPAVRLGVCLTLRRLQRPEIAQFLNDADPQIVLEAARAIYDAPIPEALPELAKASVPPASRWRSGESASGTLAARWRRVLNANYRLGQAENARRLADFAASDAPDALRAEALELLALWPQPPGRDRMVGLWRPLPSRDSAVAAQALRKILPQLESTAPSIVKVAAKKAATELGLLASASAPATGDAAMKKFSAALENGSLAEKQNALAALATVDDAGAAKLLSTWLDKLVTGQVAKELQLDVLEAVGKSQSLLTSAATKEKLAKFEDARDTKDALAKWRECLYGGNAEEGKKTFIERQDAACFRCHKINGEGGEVGPEMIGLAAKQTREHLLESILFPNKTIAPGFESVLVTLKNGTSYAGLLKSETDAELVINSPEDGLLTVKKADVKSRDRGLSAMPEELGNILSKSDLRNLIEFLSTLK